MLRLNIIPFIPFLCLFLLISDHLFSQNRGLQPDDYYQFQFISDPQISPDGSHILFTRSVIADDKRTRESSIWIASSTGDFEPRAFTSGRNDRSPRWSPDGEQIAFLANRDDETKIWMIPFGGGEAKPLFSSEHNISGFEWSPDGSRLLLRLGKDLNHENEKNSDEPQPDVRIVTTSLYKGDRTGILPDRRTHLWVYHMDSDSLQQLTWGDSWNAGSASFSPNGLSVIYHANPEEGDYEGSYNSDLFVIPADSGAVKKLTRTGARATSPVWSPDGGTIAFSYSEGRYEKNLIYLINSDGTGKRNASDELDLIPGNIHWSADSRHLYFEADERGGSGLFRLSVETGEIEPAILGRFSAGNVSYSDSRNHIAFLKSSETMLPEVFTASAPGFEPEQVTRLNHELLDTLRLNQLESFWFENESGGSSQGFLLKPVDWEEGESYPLVLNIKGGPGGMWGYQWFHEFQMMAARGYAVFFTNYRGSHGYGFDHQSAVFRDYGGADYRDNIDGLQAALERYPWIDRDRIFITGGSHGGFLTNWITAHHPEMFRAAVTQRSVSNWISEAGTQAYVPQAMREEFGGTLWENYDLYWGRSPLKYADRVKTPTLIIHSERDHITPIGQAEEWYYALKINDVPVEMAIFQGEGHGLSRTGTPINLVKRLSLILDWFERHDR
jgi:dipeptidyl aminopeptidase/acylaminoacyl peptidase